MTSPRVGLVGYCCPTGLGYENRRMCRKLDFAKWLVVPHAKLGLEGAKDATQHCEQVVGYSPDASAYAVDLFLTDLDIVVAVERTFPRDLFLRAKARGIRTVLLVNSEWCAPNHSWFQDADLFIARNAYCTGTLRALGYSRDRIVQIKCPLDLDELSFRLRARADSFVFSNGWGGVDQRKGWPTILAALRENPDLPLTVFSQTPLDCAPRGLDVRGAVSSPADLYDGFDVAVQPSYFEGVGLSFLEAMALGLPVIATSAPPMIEYIYPAYGDQVDRVALVEIEEQVATGLWRPWPKFVPSGAEVAQRITAMHRADIEELSRRGRAYVEREHGNAAWARLDAAIRGDG